MTAGAAVHFGEADYLASLGERERGTLGAPERPAPPAPEPFPTVRVLEGAAPEPPGVIVDSLLVDRDLNLWAGHGGAFKSVVALHATVCVALGRPVFGTLEVRRPGAVLIVAPEDGQAAVRMMLDAIVCGMDLDATDRATLTDRLHMIPDDSLVNLLTDTRRLMRTAQEHGAVLVLLDPLRNLLGAGGDENDNAIAGLCLDVLRRDVCREAGAAVLLNAHTRKPGKDSGPDTSATVHELRGASAWAAGARLVFGVTNKAGRVTLSALKANRLRSDLRHELRLEILADPDLATRWRSVTVTDANAGARSDAFTPFFGRRLNENERSALRVLEDEPDSALSWSQWSKRSGLVERTFTNTKTRLTRAGLAESLPTTKRAVGGGFVHVYRITPTGRNALLGEVEE